MIEQIQALIKLIAKGDETALDMHNDRFYTIDGDIELLQSPSQFQQRVDRGEISEDPDIWPTQLSENDIENT